MPNECGVTNTKRLRFLARRLFDGLVRLLFPPLCPVCGDVSGEAHVGAVCSDCIPELTAELEAVCPHCSCEPQNCGCAPTLADEFSCSPFTAVDRLVFCGYYNGYDKSSALSRLIYRTKRAEGSGGDIFLARMISSSLMHHVSLVGENISDYTLTYIPRSSAAVRKYGFDHMRSCAKAAARLLGCEFADIFVRHGGTDQKSLSADERRRNAESTIALRRGVDASDKKFILIDDVITTGATMRTAMSLISLSGALKIIPAAAFLSKKAKK